jgi:predicted Na+-dependent transporter
MLVVLLISFMMGLLLDIETLLKILKMPVPIFIGLGCQYIIMPLVRLIGAKFTYKKIHFYFIRFDLSYLLVLLVCCSFPMRKDWPYFYTAARQVKIILSISSQ